MLRLWECCERSCIEEGEEVKQIENAEYVLAEIEKYIKSMDPA